MLKKLADIIESERPKAWFVTLLSVALIAYALWSVVSLLAARAETPFTERFHVVACALIFAGIGVIGLVYFPRHPQRS